MIEEGVFTDYSAVLHVPKGTLSLYESSDCWKNFIIKDDIEIEGIRSINNEELEKNNAIYDLQGRRVAHPKQGEIYIQNGKKYINK